jgi:hypothetical protein
LTKTDLIDPVEGHDDGWLFLTSVVQAASPNVLGDYMFTGMQGDLQYVNFRFTENTLQVLDGRQFQRDDPNNENDDTPIRTERVLFELEGKHVDVRLKETLDGERTNFVEENTEEPWQRRQHFKTEFEKINSDPAGFIFWAYNEWMQDCVVERGKNIVPNSFEFDKEDQHLSWVLEVNYELLPEPGCYDMVSLATETGTATVRYRLSFYRRPLSDYEPVVVGEKDEVNKKYGAFQSLALFRDPVTGLLDADSLLMRWNPNRDPADPVVFYFHRGFPPDYKPMFEEIARQTNRVLEEAGAGLRFDFRDYNHGGIERNFGDIRYSFVNWHQDIDTTRGLLGYGPSNLDPRTGEILSANLNLYNIGMDYYRYLIEEYLADHGAQTLQTLQPDVAEEDLVAWEELACEPGETVVTDITETRLRTGLFSEMRRVMELPEPETTAEAMDLFLPELTRPLEAFQTDYLRTLGEYRYVRPEWNDYVYFPGREAVPNFRERMAVEKEFRDAMISLQMNEDPFGGHHSGREGIERMNEFADKFRQWRRNHEELNADLDDLWARRNVYQFDMGDAFQAISNGARQCKRTGQWESDKEYRERIVEDVIFHVAIHEFGHNLSLRHNFYGSIDAAHMHEDEVSTSVMDYVRSQHEVGGPRAWGAYDQAALKWIYGTKEVQDEMMEEDMLFCTDQHRYRSPLCTAHDLGVTPSQIVLNSLETYDWLYQIRNRRAFRKFWNTNRYYSSVFSSIFNLQRMLYLGIFDWAGGGVQDVLKRLDQVDPDREVLTDQQYDAISVDFYNDIIAAADMVYAFYDAVINQPASTRNYQTEFDPYYGDVLRMGIFVDKYYATFAFLDLQDVYNYNPNVETYLAFYDSPIGNRNFALTQRVLDDMLGANYDTYPWFKYLALNLFAYATNTNMIGGLELRERIAIRRYENLEEFIFEFSEESLEQATDVENRAQTFIHNGEEYIYTYLPDQGWHLVANRSRNPVSFQFIHDHNNAVRGRASGGVDNYGLKILLAYYEYYTNFSGF